MKRTICIILVFMFILTGCGIGSGESVISQYETLETIDREHDNYYRIDDSGNKSWVVNTLPFSVNLGEISANLESVKFFELYANHGYTPYIIVKLDRQELTDDDIYWMTKRNEKYDVELDINCYIDHEKNKIDKSMVLLGIRYDRKYLYFIYSLSGIERYSFIGSEFSVQIIYCPETFLAQSTEYSYYRFDITEDNYADSVEILDSDERRSFMAVFGVE